MAHCSNTFRYFQRVVAVTWSILPLPDTEQSPRALYSPRSPNHKEEWDGGDDCHTPGPHDPVPNPAYDPCESPGNIASSNEEEQSSALVRSSSVVSTSAASTDAPVTATAGETFEQELSVGAGSSADVAVPVSGGSVDWCWTLKGGATSNDDVGFSAVYIPGAKDGKHVYRASRDAKVRVP